MAILKVNFDKAGRDVLDNFLPFLADRAFHLQPQTISLPQMREAIRDEFGLAIPGGVLKIITGRCVKRGLFVRETGILYPNREALEEFDLSATRNAIRREHAALVNLGLEHASKEFDLSLKEDEFNDALNLFIRDNAAPLLAAVVDGSPLLDLDVGDPTTSDRLQYVIGSFISRLAESEPQGFNYLAAVVKGALLASALYFPDSTSFSTRLDRLAIYADTTLLFRALGASGPDLQLLAIEAISLAQRLGARVYCFKHTLEEMLGVLDACHAALRRANRYAYGETTDYMVSAGWGAKRRSRAEGST